MSLLIKNGLTVLETGVEKVDLYIEDGAIAGILAPGEAAGINAGQVIDAAGMYIAPGAIDPHMHLGLYSPLDESYRLDTEREVIGGTTTLIDYHRGKGNYFETVSEEIQLGEKNSHIDFAISLGLCAKKHLDELTDYIKKLGITSFKFFFDKQDIAHTFYGIPKEEALTLDKADLFRILKRLTELGGGLVLCVHCEDPDMFRFFSEETKAQYPQSRSLSHYSQARPDFTESNCLAGAMLINGEVNGHLYMVHCSAAKSLDVYNVMSRHLPCGEVTIETCLHYLLFDCQDSDLGAKVNPAIHSRADAEALWNGIREGSVKTIGTDNVPGDLANKFEKGDTLWDTMVGFSTPGLIWPVLISEGYHKRGIPLHTLSAVASINSARTFLLKGKGEIKIGYDADLVIMDLNLERTIDKSLFGFSDFSIYEGMTFKGWPKYTIGRGEILQQDGVVKSMPGRGKYLFRGSV
jgi:dihydroorotase-like cyclic amidohydrolase